MLNERTFRASEFRKLEDPERLKWLPPIDVVGRLGLFSGMTIADVGAGTGYFSIPFAREIGDAGRVFAVDLQPEMLDILAAKLAQPGAPANIVTMVGAATETGIADRSCDLVFLANIWHELEDHDAVLRESARILRRPGKIAILDWRPGVQRPPGPPLDHRISSDAVVEALKTAGWKADAPHSIGPYSYLVITTI